MKIRPVRDLNPDRGDTVVALYQLTEQANWNWSLCWFPNKPVEWCENDYRDLKIIHANCGQRYERESDLRSNEHYLSSSENKALYFGATNSVNASNYSTF